MSLNPIELTIKQESILEGNLVWIFGSPRSGTTWLARKLLKHTTHLMDEPLIGTTLATVTGKGNHDWYQIHKARKDYFFSDEYSVLWKNFIKKMILNRIYCQFLSLSKKIIIKEPNGSFGSNIISQCLPNSKIIILLRDGRDIMDSNMDARSEGGWQAVRKGKAITGEERIPFLKQLARNWNVRMNIVMETYDNHKENLRYIVRYENLRKNTTEELENIYKFLDIKIEKNRLKTIVTNSSFENIPAEKKGKGKPQRSATPGGWKDNMRKEEIKVMEKIMGSTLKRLGYE